MSYDLSYRAEGKWERLRTCLLFGLGSLVGGLTACQPLTSESGTAESAALTAPVPVIGKEQLALKNAVAAGQAEAIQQSPAMDTKSAPGVAAEVPDSAMMVVDLGNPHLTVLRMQDGARLFDYSLLKYQPELCKPSSLCVLYETKHKVIDDQDLLTYVMTEFGHNFQSSLHRVAMADPENPVWDLRALDYSAVPSSSCNYPSTDTCDPEVARDLDFKCGMRFAHSFQILEENPAEQWVKLIITDTLNGRIQLVRLDYADGNQCGKIEWMLDASNPEWDPECGPNDVQIFSENGSDYMMVSCHTVASLFGQGQVQLFKGDFAGPGTVWQRVWAYPDPADVEQEIYLNTPHHPRLFAQDDGSYVLSYAHSDALGAFWGVGNSGAVGTARLASLETPPDYISDEGIDVLDANPTFGFLRSAEVLDSGMRIVTDSMHYVPYPGVESRIYLMGPNGSDNSSLNGNWTRDSSNLNLVEARDNVIQSYTCKWWLAWGTYEIKPEAFGAFLRERNVTADQYCSVDVP